MDPRIGSELLGYRIEALLGRGGMSVVYRAHHGALDRKVALKLLAPELAEDERFRERFLRESKLAASIDHPSIVPIYEAGEADGQLYIAMRYVEGTDLKRLLRGEGVLEPKRAFQLLAQLADALDTAHARGLVHRDVKPSNALLDEAGHVYLADFGLTKSASDRSALTATGRIVGTVDYAAPEQIEGKSVDGRADTYSLGCLLYECLTGEVPFSRDSELAVLWAHVHDKPPTVPAYPALDPVIAKALAKDPADRYASCAELVEEAREALGLREVVVVRDRRPLLLAALGALVAAGALAAGLVLALGGGGGPKPDLTVRNNTLVRIDPKTNKITAVTKVGRRPKAVAVAGGTVWVYNTDDRTVSAIDARTSAVERTVSISGSSPAESVPLIAADKSGAWVVSSAGGKGVLTHVRPGVAYQPEFSLGYDPGSVALGAGDVWVAANSVRGNAVLRISPSTGAVLGKVPFRGGVEAGLFWIAVGEGAVWVTNQAGTLFRIDPATTRITGRVRLGGEFPLVAAGDGAVFFSDWQERRLLRIDPRTLRTTKTISHPGFDSQDVALGEGSVWWNGFTTGTVWRVDPRMGKIASTIRVTPPRRGKVVGAVDFHPWAIAISARSLWVTVAAG